MLPLGNPDALDALAARLDRDAAEYAACAATLRQRARTISWQAPPRSDRWRADNDRRANEADRIAHDLGDIARGLRRSAVRLRVEYQALGGLERKVKAWMASIVKTAGESQAPWVGTRWKPGSLPSPGDPAWRDVARTFGIR